MKELETRLDKIETSIEELKELIHLLSQQMQVSTMMASGGSKSSGKDSYF